MVAHSFARLSWLAGLPGQGRRPLPQPVRARAFPRMNLPEESLATQRPAERGRDLRLRAVAAELLSRA